MYGDIAEINDLRWKCNRNLQANLHLNSQLHYLLNSTKIWELIKLPYNWYLLTKSNIDLNLVFSPVQSEDMWFGVCRLSKALDFDLIFVRCVQYWFMAFSYFFYMEYVHIVAKQATTLNLHLRAIDTKPIYSTIVENLFTYFHCSSFTLNYMQQKY